MSLTCLMHTNALNPIIVLRFGNFLKKVKFLRKKKLYISFWTIIIREA